MPRPLVVGNGRLLINLDDRLQMRDLYYPHVGQLNHIGGYACKLGVWADGAFAWLDAEEWRRTLRYHPDTLVTAAGAEHDGLQVSLLLEECVHHSEPLYIRRVKVTNREEKTREFRLFFHHDFSLHETEVGDTAVYDPKLHAVYHYKRRLYLLANGRAGDEGLFQYSIGIKRFHYSEGTWRDAEDGVLDGNPIAQGSVDSTISFRLTLAPGETRELYYWLCVGECYRAVVRLNQLVLEQGPGHLLGMTARYWESWVTKEQRDIADLPPEVVRMYNQSLLLVRTQIDNGGAIIAANDTDILHFNRDHYSYMWPRDGALIALALCRAGHHGVVSSFFRFCAKALTADGYLLHKYNPDGSAGSSWHPFVAQGERQLPIQEDETALVLYALWEYYQRSRQFEFCQSLYPALVYPASAFMLEYVHPELGLPLPSYDLWEERRGIYTFTCASVYAGLKAAARFAGLFGDDQHAVRCDEGAERIREAMRRHLYAPDLGRYLRGLVLDSERQVQRDDTLESSLFALFSFGVFPADDPQVASTMEAIRQGLWVQTPVGGYARYRGDQYFRKSADVERIPGNPWIICTLWMAEWEIAKAASKEELTQPLQRLQWVCRHALESGVLPEQLDPFTGDPVSVAPLTWSHATFVSTVLKYLEKAESFHAG